jgi:alpha-galactosidase
MPCFCSGVDIRAATEEDWATLKALNAEWWQIAACLFGDYYPLTPFSLENDVWIAWQFDLPAAGEGVIQAFRRGDSPTATQQLTLRGLDAAATYAIHDFDTSGETRYTGAALLHDGLTITLSDAASACTFKYTRIETVNI